MTQQECNTILDNLRSSGTMNMFGAPRHLEQQHGLPRVLAKQMFANWCARVTAIDLAEND